MIIKLCGIKSSENYEGINESLIDMVGFNFYSPSVRYIGDSDPIATAPYIQRVGVFVNEKKSEILKQIKRHRLDIIQLHGDETVEFCSSLSTHIPIIKVFRLDNNFHWSRVEKFNFCKFFLFDTNSKYYGGSGKKFDWDAMSHYDQKTPFLLSGGIGPDDVEALLNFHHPECIGIDINSRFEYEPGLKSAPTVNTFCKKIKNQIHA